MQFALSVCERIYGDGISLQKAEAHEAVAKALMATQQLGEYHTHAVQAWRAALDSLDSNHPRLANFKYTLGMGTLYIYRIIPHLNPYAYKRKYYLYSRLSACTYK